MYLNACSVMFSIQIRLAGPTRHLTLLIKQPLCNHVTIRYVSKYTTSMGVYWVWVSFSKNPPIRFAQGDMCCIDKSTIKYKQTSDWKSNLHWFSYDCHKSMFVEFSNEYMDPPNYIHYNEWGNQLLDIDEPVEFEESNCWSTRRHEITDHFRRVYGIYLKLIRKIGSS